MTKPRSLSASVKIIAFSFSLLLSLSCQAQTTEEEWKQEAVKRYPTLGVEGTALNELFVAQSKELRITAPEFFHLQDWPVILAQRCEGLLKKAYDPVPVAIAIPRLSARTKAAYSGHYLTPLGEKALVAVAVIGFVIALVVGVVVGIAHGSNARREKLNANAEPSRPSPQPLSEIDRAQEEVPPPMPHEFSAAPCSIRQRFGRGAYFLSITSIAVVSSVFLGIKGLEGLGILTILVCFIPVILRLHDIGTSGWWSLMSFVPLLNFALGYCLLCVPTGYAQTKTPDRKMKVLSMSFIALVASIIIAAFFLLLSSGRL